MKQMWGITYILSEGGGQYADLISVVCTKSVTSNSTSGRSEHASLLAFIQSRVPTLNEYEDRKSVV